MLTRSSLILWMADHDQEFLDSVVIPNPAPLKIRKLDHAFLHFVEEGIESYRVGFKHRNSPNAGIILSPKKRL